MCWFRTNKNAEMLAAIHRLERRMCDIEGAIVVICDHIEALEEKAEAQPKRIANLLERWRPPDAAPM
jgi:hypothetical protein